MGRTLDNELYDNVRYVCRIGNKRYYLVFAGHFWKDIVVVVDNIRVVIDEIYEDYEVELFNKLYINYADEEGE